MTETGHGKAIETWVQRLSASARSLLGSAALAALVAVSGVSAAHAQDAAPKGTEGASEVDPASTDPDWAGARGVDNADPVARGKYLTLAADCMPCHTAPNGEEFAGGLMLNTPFGGLSTPNITPDKETGIGSWTFEQFHDAIHNGIGNHGEFLYPVLPFPSFTKITKNDSKAIYAYLQSVKPVNKPRVPSTMSFPFNVRMSLAAWRELFFKPGVYSPDASWPEDVQRGGYLVEALGHCGACHSPRNVMGATETKDAFAGGSVDTFFAPNISSSITDGIGGWSKDQVVEYLTKGATKTKGSVFGPMEEVVTHSLSKIAEEDIEAIAAYLLHTPAQKNLGSWEADTTKHAGAKIYLDNCAQCHQSGGTGIPNAVPPLAGNGAVTATEPDDVISAVIGGLPGRGSYGQMPSFAGQFSDKHVVEVVNYVRTAWGNKGSANATEAKVVSIREELVPDGPGSEAARKLGCPLVTNSGNQNAVTDPGAGIVDLMQGVDDDNISNKISEMLHQLHTNNPSISDADAINDLMVAYCPIVAKEGGSKSQMNKKLHAFLDEVNEQLSSGEMPAGSKVLVKVPLPQETANQVLEDAKSSGQKPGAYLADKITGKSSSDAKPDGTKSGDAKAGDAKAGDAKSGDSAKPADDKKP